MDNPKELTQNLIRQPYAWPGGYPLYAIMQDGGCLCHKCTRQNYRAIREAQRGVYAYPEWNLTAVGVNWEDNALLCDFCFKPIEAAYGSDDIDMAVVEAADDPLGTLLDLMNAKQKPEPCPYCGWTTKTYDPYRGYDACDGCGVI